MGEKVQFNSRIPAEVHGRLDDILARLRKALGTETLTMNDVSSMAIDLLDQWLALYEEGKVGFLRQVEPRPQEPLDEPRQGRGRPRKTES